MEKKLKSWQGWLLFGGTLCRYSCIISFVSVQAVINVR